MNISIIIPNYNGAALLQKNISIVIDSVISYKKGKVEIIIPDDASTDNSKEIIEQISQKYTKENITIKYIFNKDNKGFTSNVNSGIKITTGEILILLNSDVQPHKDFLVYLLPHFENENVFAVACMDESIENEKVVLRGRGIGSWQRGFLVHRKGEINTSDKTLWASGGSSAFRKSIWEKIGGLYSLYNPFYWEDIDISYRALKAGYTIIFEKRSVVIHEHEIGAIKTHNTSSRITQTAYRNQFFFVWLNATDISLIFSHLFWLPYHVIHTLLRGDVQFLVGFFLACKKISTVLLLRKKIQNLQVLTDKAVINSVQ